jgi:segregation and condensation protein B
MVTLRAVVESLVFSSQKALTAKEVLHALKGAEEFLPEEQQGLASKVSEEQIQTVLQELATEYQELNRAFQLVEQVAGWQVASRPEYQLWVRQLFPELRPTRLSPPALETLAIIAYRQPITKGDIEAIRGVAVDGVMQKLLDHGLVKIVGRAEIPGRPLLYETTQHFMEHFGLRNLNELPNSDELRRVALPAAPPAEENKPEEKTEPAPAGETESTSEAAKADGNPVPVREPAKVESNSVPEAVENANVGENHGEP